MLSYKKIIEKHPYVDSYLFSFLLNEYQQAKNHLEGYAKKVIGKNSLNEKLLNQKLLELGYLKKDRKGKLTPIFRRVYTRILGKEINHRIKTYWLERILKAHRDEELQNKVKTGCFQLTGTEDNIAEIERIIDEALYEISQVPHRVYKNDPPNYPNHLRVVTFSIFDPSRK